MDPDDGVHVRDAVLMDYAAGSLSPATALVVATHAAMRPDARADVADWERIAAALWDEMPPAAMTSPDGPFSDVPEPLTSANDDAPVTDTPRPLYEALGHGLDAVAWRRVIPGLKRRRIDAVSSPTSEAALLSLSGGRRVPMHGHTGLELTLVLRGALIDGGRRYGVGDLAVADAETEHDPHVARAEDCVCLTAVEGRTRLAHPLLAIARSLLH